MIGRRYQGEIPSGRAARGFATVSALILAILATTSASAKEPGPLDLEEAIARADLVLVAKVVEVSEEKIVFGGKAERVTQQFRLEPVRTLRGIFARDALLLTNDDLGTDRFGEGSGPIERGQWRLLILGRRGPGYANVNQAGSLDLSIPPVKGEDDPLLRGVETLIAVTQQRDRGKKVLLLLDGLRTATGPAAVPLLVSLGRRPLLAAQAPGVEGIGGTLGDSSPAVREAAARTLRAVLDADYLAHRALRESAVRALAGALERGGPDVAARVAALEALGAVGEPARREPALDWLRVDRASATLAERAARFRAIGQLELKDRSEAVAKAVDELPLDAPDDLAQAASGALVRLDAPQALKRLDARLKAKHDGGLNIPAEIGLLGTLPVEQAVPALVEVARLSLDHAEKVALAQACRKVPDARLVPILAGMLDPRRGDFRWHATEALLAIDTDEAARTLRPHLAQEADLSRKLQLAEFLGRHGFRDGYPYAIEHVSEPGLREQAVKALAAIRDPRAIEALEKVWATSHDQAWDAAAIRALGRLGAERFAPRMLEIAQDLQNPLAPSALIALGDLGEAKALPIVREGFSSRSDEVVTACARAAGTLLARDGVRADDVRDRMAALLGDGEASPSARGAALDSLVALKDARLDGALGIAVRDARLEGSYLLARVEKVLKDRKVPVTPP